MIRQGGGLQAAAAPLPHLRQSGKRHNEYAHTCGEGAKHLHPRLGPDGGHHVLNPAVNIKVRSSRMTTQSYSERGKQPQITIWCRSPRPQSCSEQEGEKRQDNNSVLQLNERAAANNNPAPVTTSSILRRIVGREPHYASVDGRGSGRVALVCIAAAIMGCRLGWLSLQSQNTKTATGM